MKSSKTTNQTRIHRNNYHNSSTILYYGQPLASYRIIQADVSIQKLALSWYNNSSNIGVCRYEYHQKPSGCRTYH